ncbi:MAG: ABC transporter substrate-binding protein [Candidatus Tectomicrobia bacterium]|uniref:ABC transporter substrate-binding protein n=1 Tax=Tectimicrobiota bacterium TaxID=2528274 RepID=A0A932HZ00_UNCTE|nr:ABC transporter substrate-binding protein [Candidatus Tectomicrobia bacterium]
MMWTRTAAVMAALALVLAPAAGAEAAKRGGTLRIGIEGEAPDLNVIGINFARKVYREAMGNGLVRLDENFEVVGDAAKEWEVSEDGRIITFKLHPGGTYHDGAPLDAASVKWNLDLINKTAPKWAEEMKKKNPKYKWRNIWVGYLFHIDQVDVIDKYTVRVRQKDLGKAQTFDAMSSAFSRFVLVSPKAYDTDLEKFRLHPVLSGPFKFVEWKRNQHLFAERHKGYFDKNLPYVDRIEFYFMPDANQRMNALAAGQIDIINNLPLPLYETAKKTEGVKVLVGPNTINYAVPINGQMDPWKDVRVRRALGCYGIDRAQIVRTALRGLGKPWASYSPAGAKDALDLTKECPHDPAKAKKLLAEAGYGPGKPLKITLTTNNSDPAHLEVSQALKSQFGQLGVDMEIRVVDYATWNRAFVAQRRLQLTLQNTLSSRTVNSNSHTIHSKSGIDYYNIKDPKVDAFLDEWRSNIDPRKQLEASHKLQRYMVEQGYYPNIASFGLLQAARDYVKGFTNLGKLMLDYRAVWLDK